MLPEYMTPILNAHDSTILGLGVFVGTPLVVCLPRIVRWLWRHWEIAALALTVGMVLRVLLCPMEVW